MASASQGSIANDGLPGTRAQGRAQAAYLALHAGWFLGTTLLLSWGLFVLFFLAIGGFSIDGLMHQLNNLAGRYVTADPARVSSFREVVLITHFLLSAGIIFFRRRSILPPDRSARHG